MYIDLYLVASWFLQIGIILGAIVGGFKVVDKHLLKRISANDAAIKSMEKIINDQQSWTAKQQKDIAQSADAMRMLIEGQLACLEALREQGCNGMVLDNIDKLKSYLYSRVTTTSRQ